MKKLLLFGAALFAVATINAASFQGFDGRDGTLGTQIHDGNLIQNQSNVVLEETETTDHKYSIKNEVSGECSFTMGGIEFWGSDQQAGKEIYKTYKTYIQPNGARRKVTIPTVAGEKVRIYIQDELTFAVEGAAEGASVTFKAFGSDKEEYTVLTATGSSIVLWSDDRADSPKAQKFKLAAILPDGTSALVDVEAEGVKAVKVIENGQLFIIRNGVKYNALGGVVAE